jgi:hypothetical protein
MVQLTGPVKELKRVCEYIQYPSRLVLKVGVKKDGAPTRPHNEGLRSRREGVCASRAARAGPSEDAPTMPLEQEGMEQNQVLI